MTATTASATFVQALNELFTRSYYSAAGYVFESQPFAHEEDDDALRQLREIRKQERQHARMLAQILESLDRVPEPGAFPYWYRDLNYLTVPFLGGFVIEALETDLAMYDAALEMTPEAMGLARTMLDAIRAEKAVMLKELRPIAAEAKELEAKRYAAGIAEVKKARAKRLAEEKAKREALRKGGASPSAAVAAASAGPSFEDWAKANSVLDPDEAGIDNKEKGKRRVLWGRARKKYEKERTPGAAADGGGGQTFEQYAAANGVLDPDEAGIDNKEKGKRRVLWGRAKKKWAAEQSG